MDKFDKTAYQREYMRKWRKKKDGVALKHKKHPQNKKIKPKLTLSKSSIETAEINFIKKPRKRPLIGNFKPGSHADKAMKGK